MKLEHKQKKRLMTAASVFAVALGTGFAMQTLGPVADQFGGGSSAPMVAGTSGLEPQIQPLSTAPIARPAATPLSDKPITLPAEEDEAAWAVQMPGAQVTKADSSPAAAMPQLPAISSVEVAVLTAPATGDVALAPLSEASTECPMNVTATPAPAALLEITVEAPCLAREVVTISHMGLVATEMLGAEGKTSVTLPALAADAHVDITFENGETIDAMAKVPDFAAYDRVALVWQGEAGVALNAYEDGAEYGAQGYIGTTAMGAPERALAGEGGFLTAFGNAGIPGAMMGYVYSYPKALTTEGHSVEVEVDVEVTADNCGREVSARFLRPADEYTPQQITASMPSCDALGDFVVLTGLLPAMQFAAAN